MTIIAAMHEEGVGTWIASDSWCTASGGLLIGHVQKWFTVQGGAVASCGSGVIRSILEEHRGEIDAEWSSIAFYRWIKPILDSYGFRPEQKDGMASYYDGSFLLATPKRVVSISGCGDGITFESGFASRGSGAEIADGAAWALARKGVGVKGIVSEAVLAAIAHGNGCGGKLWIDCLKLPETSCVTDSPMTP